MNASKPGVLKSADRGPESRPPTSSQKAAEDRSVLTKWKSGVTDPGQWTQEVSGIFLMWTQEQNVRVPLLF